MILMNVGKLRLKSKKKKLQLQSLTTVILVLRTQKGMLVWFWPRRASYGDSYTYKQRLLYLRFMTAVENV